MNRILSLQSCARGLLAFLMLSVSVVPVLGSAQELTIGVPLAPESLNLATSSHPFADIIVNAVAQPLLTPDPKRASGMRLVLADSFSVGPDGKSIELRLRRGAQFSNSELVGEEDVRASLERCQNLAGTKALKSFTVRYSDLRAVVGLQHEGTASALFEFLGKCPIYQAQVLELVGEDLGHANLLLGSGSYQLVSRIRDREARLERLPQRSGWASALNIRAFSDANHAMIALRSGTIDAFLSQDSGVKAIAEKDPTLRVALCGVYNLILRKDLEFTCEPRIDPASIKYSTL